MKTIDIYNFLLHFLGIALTFVAQTVVFSKITSFKPKINVFKIAIIIFILVLMYLNTYYNYNYTKLIFSFLAIFIMNQILFKEDFSSVLVASVITYVFGGLLELLLSIIIVLFTMKNVVSFDQNHVFKFLFSLLISLTEIFLVQIKVIKNVLRKIYSRMNIKKNWFVILGFILIFLLTISLIFKNGYDRAVINYFINIILIVISSIFVIDIFIKIKKEEEFTKKEESLLAFMSEYEKIIDENRFHNHELVNNLLLIRDYCDKDSKTSKELINDLIQTYDNTKFKKIYNLPSGLKGLFYYKIALIKNDVDLIFNCSDKVEKKLLKIEDKKYKNLYKALSIILDNAVEAIQKSKEKILIIDIYFEKQNLVFYIENSFEGKVDESKIYEKDYSSKGKKRGLGLYILKTIISKASDLLLEQKINGNKFITILKIDFLS